MNIIHLTLRFHPHTGGIEKHILEVASEQTRQGHKVTVIASDHPGELIGSERLHDFQIQRFCGARANWRIHLWFLSRIRLLQDADIIHIHDQGVLSFIRALTPKRKRILTAHGWGGIYPIPEASRQLTQRCAQQCARVIAIGDYVGKWHGFKPDTISYGAIDPKQCTNLVGVRKLGSVCLFGRLAKDTGAAETAHGLRQIAEAGRPLKITVCGDGPLAQTIKSSLDHPNIQLTWLGFYKDVYPVLAEHDIICTSGYLAILEALGCGARVFAYYDNPVKRDYLEASPMAQWMVISHDEGTVVAGLNAMLSGDNSTDRMAIQFAHAQSWHKIVRIYDEQYRTTRSPGLPPSPPPSPPSSPSS